MARSIKSAVRQAKSEDRAMRSEFSKVQTRDKSTMDSFQNFAANLGIGTNNISSASTYGFNPITRQRTLLEWIHRGSWLGGMAIDLFAEDMTKMGVEIKGTLKPAQIDAIEEDAEKFQVWEKLNEAIKWGKLYGGSLTVLLVDGQKPETPLRLETIGKDQFRGVLTLDRWMVDPSLQNVITEFGPDMGLPKFYRVVTSAPGLPSFNLHHTRCSRFLGIKLPYWQALSENMWGISVIERLFDRMVAFDSATQGAAQLVYKAYLRTYAIEGLREITAAGGDALKGLTAQISFMRSMQSLEGIALIDVKDRLEEKTGGSAGARGLADLLLHFGQQLSGALQIPLVRLFGQSPAGLSASGESDLRTYYDGIMSQQNRDLHSPVTMIYRAIAAGRGIKLPGDFHIKFRPLWIMTDADKAQIAVNVAQAVTAVDNAGIVRRDTSLKELKQSSEVTGIFSNIGQEEIAEAELEPPPSAAEQLNLAQTEQGMEHAEREQERAESGAEGENKADKKQVNGKDSRRPSRRSNGVLGGKAADSMLGSREVMGFEVVIEHEKGEVRYGSVLPADYGYIRKTDSAERGQQMDCFVGPDLDALIFVLDAYKIPSGVFDEHKILMGYKDKESALADFRRYYNYMPERTVIAKTNDPVSAEDLKVWLATGDVTKPYYEPTSVGYVAVSEYAKSRCRLCRYFDQGICANHAVHHDPKVPEDWNGLKMVSPSGWCSEFSKIAIAEVGRSQ